MEKETGIHQYDNSKIMAYANQAIAVCKLWLIS